MCESCEAGFNNGTKFIVTATTTDGSEEVEIFANSALHAAYVAGAVAAGGAVSDSSIVGEMLVETLMPWFVNIRAEDLVISVIEG